MKHTANILLIIAVVFPLILLFWPFAQWDGVMSVLLRAVPALAAQLLLCRMGKHPLIKAIPTLLTGALAAWGTYLYFTSPHWNNATVGDLIADYVSPFLCCLAVLIPYLLLHNKK